MPAFLWVILVGSVVVASFLRAGSGLSFEQRVGLAYPVFLLWAIWSVGYLLAAKRRGATRKAVERIVQAVRRDQ